MKESAVLEILKSLIGEYVKNWSDEELELKLRNWNAVLKDVTDEQGMAGFEKALKDQGEFMPTAGKFRQMCLASSDAVSIEDDAVLAWAVVIKNLNQSWTPIFKDRVITAAINNLGGWVPFCRSVNDSNEPFKRKEFISFYVMNKRRKDDLPCIPDRVCKIYINGEEKNDYRLIGDFTKEEKRIVAAEVRQVKNFKSKTAKMLYENKLFKNEA